MGDINGESSPVIANKNEEPLTSRRVGGSFSSLMPMSDCIELDNGLQHGIKEGSGR